MDWIIASIHAHPVWWAIGSFIIGTNAINAMPTPKDTSSAFYHWVFGFLQGVGGGIARVLAVYKPDLLTKLTGQEVKKDPAPAPQPQP